MGGAEGGEGRRGRVGRFTTRSVTRHSCRKKCRAGRPELAGGKGWGGGVARRPTRHPREQLVRSAVAARGVPTPWSRAEGERRGWISVGGCSGDGGREGTDNLPTVCRPAGGAAPAFEVWEWAGEGRGTTGRGTPSLPFPPPPHRRHWPTSRRRPQHRHETPPSSPDVGAVKGTTAGRSWGDDRRDGRRDHQGGARRGRRPPTVGTIGMTAPSPFAAGATVVCGGSAAGVAATAASTCEGAALALWRGHWPALRRGLLML